MIDTTQITTKFQMTKEFLFWLRI